MSAHQEGCIYPGNPDHRGRCIPPREDHSTCGGRDLTGAIFCTEGPGEQCPKYQMTLPPSCSISCRMGHPANPGPHEPPSLPKVEALLLEANGIVNGPRQKEYGHPKVNFARIATIWTIHLEGKLRPGEVISNRDVAVLMMGLKLAREAQGPKHDTLVDIIGYAALAEEVDTPDTPRPY